MCELGPNVVMPLLVVMVVMSAFIGGVMVADRLRFRVPEWMDLLSYGYANLSVPLAAVLAGSIVLLHLNGCEVW